MNTSFDRTQGHFDEVARPKVGEVVVAAAKVVFVIEEPQGLILQFANGRTIKFAAEHTAISLNATRLANRGASRES